MRVGFKRIIEKRNGDRRRDSVEDEESGEEEKKEIATHRNERQRE